MAYTIWRQCACGRRYFHRNNIPDPGQCEVCDEEKAEAGENKDTHPYYNDERR